MKKGNQPKQTQKPVTVSYAIDHLKSLTRPGKDISQDHLYAMVEGSFLQCRSDDDTHKDIWKEIKADWIFLLPQSKLSRCLIKGILSGMLIM